MKDASVTLNFNSWRMQETLMNFLYHHVSWKTEITYVDFNVCFFCLEKTVREKPFAPGPSLCWQNNSPTYSTLLDEGIF